MEEISLVGLKITKVIIPFSLLKIQENFVQLAEALSYNHELVVNSVDLSNNVMEGLHPAYINNFFKIKEWLLLPSGSKNILLESLLFDWIVAPLEN